MEQVLELPRGHTPPILSKKDRVGCKDELLSLRCNVLRGSVRVSALAQLLRSWVREVVPVTGTPGDQGWQSGEPSRAFAFHPHVASGQ
eukprot:5634794-Amphidinium_carterae.4